MRCQMNRWATSLNAPRSLLDLGRLGSRVDLPLMKPLFRVKPWRVGQGNETVAGTNGTSLCVKSWTDKGIEEQASRPKGGGDWGERQEENVVLRIFLREAFLRLRSGQALRGKHGGWTRVARGP